MYDFCIIGAGPAGLSLCAELADSGKKIAVIECGGRNPDIHANSLRTVKNVGEISIRTSSRERIFGGTSTTWTGISAPLDTIDFSRWPISLEELRPYYEKASRYGFPFFDEFAEKKVITPKIEGKIFIASDPAWNFGEKLAYLFERPNIDIFLNSTVIHLNSKKNEKGVTHVTTTHIIQTPNNEIKKITAKTFIIAAGGIESIRLLLLSRETSPQGLGNEYGNVGRYLTNHPKGNFGELTFFKPQKDSPHILHTLRTGWTGYVGLRLNENIQRSLGILNSYIRFEPTNSLKDRILRRLFPSKKVRIRKVHIRNFMEMEARAENRLTLSEQKDAYGKEIPEIKLNTFPLDRRSVIELHTIFKDEMKKSGIGIFKSNLAELEKWPIVSEASHHLGGTIMGNNPKTSVVDKNLKVHSVENLYIASGSVFPTSGCANPTYTICALSIRLAEKLKTLNV